MAKKNRSFNTQTTFNHIFASEFLKWNICEECFIDLSDVMELAYRGNVALENELISFTMTSTVTNFFFSMKNEALNQRQIS